MQWVCWAMLSILFSAMCYLSLELTSNIFLFYAPVWNFVSSIFYFKENIGYFCNSNVNLTSDFFKVSIYTINVQLKFKYFGKVVIGALWEVTDYQEIDTSVQFIKVRLVFWIFTFLCCVLKRYFSLVDRFSTKLIQFATCCEFLLLLL